MYIPGFDPKKMTDDELFNKVHDLNKKIVYAHRFTSMGQGIEQMQMMLNMLENERHERIFMEGWKITKDYMNETIETDPELRDKQRNSKEKEKKQVSIDNSKRQRPPERRIIATPTPTATPSPSRPQPLSAKLAIKEENDE